LRIVVSDPGPGFDPASLEKEGGGFGLCSIRERLDIIGGKMMIESAPGNSSRFTLIAPLSQISEAKSPVNL
jgi:signal transduction histidine kinase